MNLLVVLFIRAAICCFCMQYAVNEWLVHVGKLPQFLWWYGLPLALVPWATPPIVFAAIVTFVATFFW